MNASKGNELSCDVCHKTFDSAKRLKGHKYDQGWLSRKNLSSFSYLSLNISYVPFLLAFSKNLKSITNLKMGKNLKKSETKVT